MAINILAQLGFSFSQSSVKNIVQSTTVIKDSILNLGPVFNDLKDKIDDASHVTKWVGFGNAISGVFGGVKSIVGSVAGDFKKIYDFVDGYAQKGDKVAKTSRLVGLSVKDYQALSSAAVDSGMSIESMDASLKKFAVNLGKAKAGDSKSFEIFDAALGGKELSAYKSSREVLLAIADGYKALNVEQKAFVSSGIFGKSGIQMSEILSQGGESLKNFLDAYDKGFDEKGASNAEAFTHEFQKMNEEIEQIKMSVAMDLFPVFKDLFTTISDMLHGGSGDELKSQFKGLGESVGKFVKDLLPRIPKILESIITIIDMISPEMLVIFGAVLKIFPVILQIFTSVAAIKPLISMISVKIGGILGMTGGALAASVGGILILFIEIFSIVKQFYDNWDMWCSFVNNELTDAVNGFFSDIWNGIKNAGSFLYDLFVEPFLNFFSTLPAIVAQAWEGFKNGVAQVGKFIYDSFFGAISGAINAAKGLLSSLPIVGSLFSDSSGSALNSVSSAAASVIQQSSVTTTNRFAVDFNNAPQGTKITPPSSGDFDWSRSYTLAGAV